MLKRIAVVYRSKYGATKRYAQWLKEALDADLYENKRLDPKSLAGYEAVILAGGIMASGIKGIDLFTKQADALRGKRLYVLGVGASPASPEVEQSIKDRYAAGALEQVPFYYARGAWDVSAMTTLDRGMCSLLHKTLKNKPKEELPVWAAALVESWDEKADWTDRAYLMPLIDRVLKDQANG